MLPAFAIPSLISAGATGLNFLGNSLNQRSHNNDMQRLLQLLSPGAIGSDTNKLFDVFRNSPMYSAMRGRAITGANQLANNINARSYKVGLGSSGLAAAAHPLAQSSMMNSFNDIDSNLFMKALSQVQANRGMQAQAMIANPSSSPGGQAFGSLFEFLGPYLRHLMAQKF